MAEETSYIKNIALGSYNVNPIIDEGKQRENNISSRKIGDEISDNLFEQNTTYDLLNIPNWNLQDFIKERVKFKNIGLNDDKFGERGFYFYKVFFNFYTSHGLLGSILKSSNGKYSKSNNTAFQYLTNNMYSDRFGGHYQLSLFEKRNSLEQFVKLLNYICNECPWFFKSIAGLDTASKINFKEIYNKSNIQLECNPDAVDFRLGTLIDLYKHACFDFVNFREVVPENLRKFDMYVVLFNPPILGLNYVPNDSARYTSGLSESLADTIKIDDADNPGQISNSPESSMSFRCLVLKNCEIDINELGSFPSNVTNEETISPEYFIPIKFDRSFMYNINHELNINIFTGDVNIDYKKYKVGDTSANQSYTNKIIEYPQTEKPEIINPDEYIEIPVDETNDGTNDEPMDLEEPLPPPEEEPETTINTFEFCGESKGYNKQGAQTDAEKLLKEYQDSIKDDEYTKIIDTKREYKYLPDLNVHNYIITITVEEPI